MEARGTGSNEQGTNLPSSANGESALRALALRLLHHPGDSRWSAHESQLLVGRLPDELPFELPFPEGSRIAGSLVRSQKSIDILLDAYMPPEKVLDFYVKRMEASGWSKPELHHMGGFVPAGEAHSVQLCRSTRGPALHVIASAEQGMPTDVRLSLETDPRFGGCEPHWRGPEPLSLLPDLRPPRQAQQSHGGAGSSSNDAYSSATLETDLDLATIAGHYATQLEQAVWSRRDSGHSGPMAWSAWIFQDDEGQRWHGLFYVLEAIPETPHRHFLHIQVNLAE